MALLKKISEVKKYEKRLADTGEATISYENGECSISSDADIIGMEINFMAILRLMEKSSICMVYRRHIGT